MATATDTASRSSTLTDFEFGPVDDVSSGTLVVSTIRDGKPNTLKGADGTTSQTAVILCDDGTVITGSAAMRKAHANADNVFFGFKPAMAEEGEQPLRILTARCFSGVAFANELLTDAYESSDVGSEVDQVLGPASSNGTNGTLVTKGRKKNKQSAK